MAASMGYLFLWILYWVLPAWSITKRLCFLSEHHPKLPGPVIHFKLWEIKKTGFYPPAFPDKLITLYFPQVSTKWKNSHTFLLLWTSYSIVFFLLLLSGFSIYIENQFRLIKLRLHTFCRRNPSCPLVCNIKQSTSKTSCFISLAIL